MLAWLVAPGGRHECFWIVLAATVATFVYSLPAAAHEAARHLGQRHDRDPARRAAQGGRLVVRQDRCRRRALVSSAMIFGLFLLGASTTKDFADMEGDARGGCRTLPIVYGVRRAAWMISPSFVVPFLLISVGASAGILTGNHALLQILAAAMTIYGTVRLLSDAAASGGPRGRSESRLLGPHVPNDVRRADRVRGGVRLLSTRRCEKDPYRRRGGRRINAGGALYRVFRCPNCLRIGLSFVLVIGF